MKERTKAALKLPFDQWVEYAAIALLPLGAATGVWELATLGW